MNTESTTKSSPLFEYIIPLLVFLFLTILAFHPLSWQLGRGTIGGRVDKYIFLWDLWWVKHSIFVLHQTPFHTEYLFSPTGCNLAYHTLNFCNGLLGIAFGSSLNILFAHNLLLLLSFALSGYFTYLLVKELSYSRLGAYIGGIIFAFSPPKWTAVFHGQMNISSTQWIPLFLFCLVKYIKYPKLRWSFLLALSLSAIFYTSYQQFIFTALLVLFIAPLTLVQYRTSISLKLIFASRFSIVALLLTLIFISPLGLQLYTHYEDAVVSMSNSNIDSMFIQFDRLIYTQSLRHWWRDGIEWGPARCLLQFVDDIYPNRGPMFGFLASSIILLGLISLPFRIQNRPTIIYLLFSLIPVIWLMMGTHPKIFWFEIPSIVPLAMKIPGLSAIRGLYRYSIPLSLLISILVAAIISSHQCHDFFNRFIRTSSRNRLFQPIRCILFFLLIAIPYLEYFKAPLLTSKLPSPPAAYLGPVLHDLTNINGDTILELPYWCSGGDFWIGVSRYETLYFQSIHGMKIVGGHHSRIGKNAVSDSVFNTTLRFLSNANLDTHTKPSKIQFIRTIIQFNIGYININRTKYTPRNEAILVDLLEDHLKAERVHACSTYITYRIPHLGSISGI